MTYERTKKLIPVTVITGITLFGTMFVAILLIHGVAAVEYAVQAGLAIGLLAPTMWVVACFDEWIPNKGLGINEKKE